MIGIGLMYLPKLKVKKSSLGFKSLKNKQSFLRIALIRRHFLFNVIKGNCFFDLTHFRGKGRNPLTFFVSFLGDLKPRKIASEIN